MTPIRSLPSTFNYDGGPLASGLVLLATGFEDRAFEFLSKSSFDENNLCVLVKFEFDLDENEAVYKKFRDKAEEKFKSKNIFEASICQNNPRNYGGSLKDVLANLPPFEGDVSIDISGMPTHAICSTLKEVRDRYYNKRQAVLYTAAKHYFPSKDECEVMKDRQKQGVEFLPPTMALEMSEILILESFSGHRSKEGTNCLTVFAGYDANRSSGVIEEINPSILLLIYGLPGGEGIDWRLDLSKELHKKFESSRKTAVESVSTLSPNESLLILEKYYENLFEDYDFTIAPVCSKMQTIAVYLFWEKYKEIQLVFPMPISYSTDRKPMGVDQTYITMLEPSRTLFQIDGLD